MRLTNKDDDNVYRISGFTTIDELIDKLAIYEDLEEQIGCPLEKMIEDLKENYLMLKEHIKIKKDYKVKHHEETRKMNVMEQFYQNGRFDEDLSISKEIKCRLENRYPMLKKDRSE